ncbi:MAG: hypothetical protein GC161_10455 [Planctomycetaceae bacterium]|nr:hypothetical protein [Planctomycetaceae bacterium]
MATDRGLALALLLPALLVLLPWPLALGSGDPMPLATAAGLCALAALPAAALAVLRGAQMSMGHLPLFVLLGLCARSAWRAGGVTDTLEFDAALGSFALFALGFLGGTSLGRPGRRVLAIGLPSLALVALVSTFADEQGGGALGNSGTLAQVALPGAAVGLALVLVGSNWVLRSLGGLAFVGAVLHAYLAPVWTTLAALALAALGLVVRATWAREGSRTPPLPRLGLALVFVALGAAAAPRLLPWSAPTAPEGARLAPSAELGGFDARLAIWSSLPAMVTDLRWHGLGPGQFQSHYPPYRSEAEIQISSAGRALPFETEVEHPHNDLLRAWIEMGPLGGAAFAALLLLALLAGLRRPSRDPVTDTCLCLAAIALCANAAVHSPILGNAASASLTGAVFGAVLARADTEPRKLRSVPAWLLLLLLLGFAPRAASLVAHGSAFLDRARALDDEDAALDAAERAAPAQAALALEQARAAALRGRAALERALAARADSPMALGLLAREALARGELEEARAHNESLLALRPHQIEGLVRRGLLELWAGEFESARAAWERCLELDARHPTANGNLLRLELEHLDPARAADRAAKLRAYGVDPDGTVRWVADAALGGWASPAQLARVLVASGAWPEAGLAEALFANAQGLASAAAELPAGREGPTALRAAGLESLAHSLWAEEHIAGGDWESARRSLRQALRASRGQGRAGSPWVALELAAIETQLGDTSRAAGLLEETPPTARALRGLPAERLERLRNAGLVPPPG